MSEYWPNGKKKYPSKQWSYEKARRAKETPEHKLKLQKRRRARVHRHKEIITKLKDVPCYDCLQRYHTICMDFDHLPGTDKKANVAILESYALKTIMEEIAKCQVVCSNCHRIRTETRRLLGTNQP